MKRLAILLCLAAGTAPGQSLQDDLRRAAESQPRAAAAAPGEVDQLTRAAGEQLRAGRTRAAVAALDRAASLAYQSGATGRAFELSLAAAEAQRSAGALEDAAERFRLAALSNPRDPRASVAHRTACETLAPTNAYDAYGALLVEHRATWPESPFAEQAAGDHLRVLARLRRWHEVLTQVGEEASHSETAQRMVVAAHDALIGPGRIAAARRDLEPIILRGDPQQWPGEWTDLQRDSALVLARHGLYEGASGAAYTVTLMRVATTGWPKPHDAWRRRAASLLVVASLVTQDAQQTSKSIADLHSGPAEERTRLLKSARERLTRGAPPIEVADRLLQSARALSGETLPAGRAAAETLATVGRDADARAAYARLVKERPNDREAQVGYAELLTESDNSDDQAEALRRWRLIESRSPPNTAPWFAARLGRLQALERLDRKEEAKKLLALTRLLAPSLGGAEMGAEFAAVAERIEGRSRP